MENGNEPATKADIAESNQTGMATIETGSEAVKKRVGILEERVLQLERKINFPNHPPQ